MYYRTLWLISLLSLLAPAVHGQKPSAKPPKLWRAIDTAGMDLSRKPWEDFYQFANGKWLAQLDLPADRPAVYVFTLLQDDNRRKLRTILEAAARDTGAPKNSVRARSALSTAAAWTKRKSRPPAPSPSVRNSTVSPP